MKPRFIPALTKYGPGTSKGLCEHCKEPLGVTSKWITFENGLKVRLHHECWNALLVQERLTNPVKPETEIWMRGTVDVQNIEFIDRPPEVETIKKLIREASKNGVWS